MLYDKRWDRQVTGLPLWSLDDFIAWLETKPAGERYRFTDSSNCAGAQYLKERGLLQDGGFLELHAIPYPIRGLVNASGSRASFGSLLRRCRWARADKWGRFKLLITSRALSWIEHVLCP